jgi:hypothetical protein
MTSQVLGWQQSLSSVASGVAQQPGLGEPGEAVGHAPVLGDPAAADACLSNTVTSTGLPLAGRNQVMDAIIASLDGT